MIRMLNGAIFCSKRLARVGVLYEGIGGAVRVCEKISDMEQYVYRPNRWVALFDAEALSERILPLVYPSQSSVFLLRRNKTFILLSVLASIVAGLASERNSVRISMDQIREG